MKIEKVSLSGTQYNLKDTTKIENGLCVNDFATNCITSIPQDIKLELSNGTLKLKSGSVVTKPNGTQYTTTSDATGTNGNTGTYLVTSRGYGLVIVKKEKCFSGNTQPTLTGNVALWLDTANSEVKFTTDGGTTWLTGYYLPYCEVTVSGGAISSIDKIFNGAGYIGHHAFVLPGVNGLIPNGFNEDGSLRGIINASNALSIFEMSSTNNSIMKNMYGSFYINRSGEDLDSIDEVQDTYNWHYIKTLNRFYRRTTELQTERLCLFVKYTYNGTSVTQFDIVQPKGLSSSELFESLKGLSSYDASKTQTLKTVNGALAWVDDSLKETMTQVDYLMLNGQRVNIGSGYIPVIDIENRAGIYNSFTGSIEYPSGGNEYEAHFVNGADDYTVVKYISATGQQQNQSNTNDAAYIYTGVTPTETTKNITRMRFTSVVTNSTEGMSGKNISGRYVWGFANVSPTTKFYVGLGGQNVVTSVTRDSNWHIFSLDWNDTSWSIDDTKDYFTSAGTSVGTGELCLFGRITSTTTDGNANKPMDGDCSCHKIIDNGVIVQNLISCIKGTTAGMYDTVTKTWLTSAGQKDFTYTA